MTDTDNDDGAVINDVVQDDVRREPVHANRRLHIIPQPCSTWKSRKKSKSVGKAVAVATCLLQSKLLETFMQDMFEV